MLAKTIIPQEKINFISGELISSPVKSSSQRFYIASLKVNYVQSVEKIKSSLNENGVYLTNIISALEGEDSKFINAEVNTLKQVFKNVYIVPCYDVEPDRPQNTMVIATDDTLILDDTYKYELKSDEIIFE